MSDALTNGARGAVVTVGGQAVKVLLQLLSVVIVSRLLAPSDFGLIAMVGVFVAFGEMVRDFGMTLIGLQRKDLSHQEASNLFWVNSGLGLVTGGILTASTGAIVLLYGEPRLWWVVPATAPTLLINGMAAQVRVQLSRSMRFLVIAIVDVASQCLGLAVTVALALMGLGYWALVASSLVVSLFSLVASWVATDWRPARPRRDLASRKLVKDGAAFGIAHFLTYLANNIGTIVIGMRWDPLSVGIYNRGNDLLMVPVQQLMGPLTQVVIPTVHRAVDEGRTVNSVLMRLQFGLGFAIIWFFAVAAAIADWFVPLLLGAGWQDVVPIFQIAAFGGFFWVFSQVNYWRVIVENHGPQLVLLNLVTKSIAIILIFFGSTISMQAVAWAVAASLAMTWLIALIWFRRVARWDSWQQFGNGMRVIIPGVVATLCGLAVMGQPAEFPRALVTVFATLVVSAVYLVGILVVPGGIREMKAVAAMAGRMLPLQLADDSARR